MLKFFITHDTYLKQQIYVTGYYLIRRLINSLDAQIRSYNKRYYNRKDRRIPLKKAASSTKIKQNGSCNNLKKNCQFNKNSIILSDNYQRIGIKISSIQKEKESLEFKLKYYFDMQNKVKSLLNCSKKLKQLNKIIRESYQEKYKIKKSLIYLKSLMDSNNPENSQKAEKQFIFNEPKLPSILRRIRSQQLLVEFHRRQCQKLLISFKLLEFDGDKDNQSTTLYRKRSKSR